MSITAQLLDRKITLKQPEDGFRVTTDTVLVAAACPAKEGQRVLDAGCGVGGISFCLTHRISGLSITGIDREEVYIEHAKKNLLLNGADNIDFRHISLIDFKSEKGFDHVVTNPPFFEHGAHLSSASGIRAGALGHTADNMTLKKWIENCRRLLKPEGTLTLIHQAEELDDVLSALNGDFGAVEIIPLWPKVRREAKRVIVRALKGRKTGSKLMAGLVLHEDNGSYTKEADKILKGGESLFA